jgi:hypothetical protein
MMERTLASAETVRRRAQEFQREDVVPPKIGLAPSISASLVLDPIAEIAKFTATHSAAAAIVRVGLPSFLPSARSRTTM